MGHLRKSKMEETNSQLVGSAHSLLYKPIAMYVIEYDLEESN